MALEWTVRAVRRAHEPIHLHVGARNVIDGRIAALLQPNGVGAVGDHLALEFHLHASGRRCGGDAMIGFSGVAGSAVGTHDCLRQNAATWVTPTLHQKSGPGPIFRTRGGSMTTATSTVPIDGTCDPRYSAVRNAFERNFHERGEVGAAVCVYEGGRKVVDLWGGHKDLERT